MGVPLRLAAEEQKLKELDSLDEAFRERATDIILSRIYDFLEEAQFEGKVPRRWKKPPDGRTIALWNLTYKALMLAFLLGMEHAGENLYFAEDWYLSVEPVTFEEALSYLAAKVPMTKEEFYALEPRLRHRAFTVARLTELDAIERVRQKLVKALREGKTFQEFWEEAGADELLQAAGFHRSNPWYWETVFRTNLQSAYNAGRRLQMSRMPGVKYYEVVGIADSRQCPICRARNGVIRPANDPWWKVNYPPYHFNCRCYVRPILKEEAQIFRIRPTPPSKLEGIPAPLEGFGVDPLISESFWRMTPSMVERARRYGIVQEINALANWLGLGRVILPEGGTPPFKGKTYGVKVGDAVPKHPGAEETTRVVAKYKDLWGNEAWITGYTANVHLVETLKSSGLSSEEASELIGSIEEFLKDPDMVFVDTKEKALMYVKQHEGDFYCLVVGMDTGKVFTIFKIKRIFKEKRYKMIYRKGVRGAQD